MKLSKLSNNLRTTLSKLRSQSEEADLEAVGGVEVQIAELAY
jgi:hypothetical protein